MEKSWKITLSDGTKLENLGLNGNNFISEAKITEDDFKGKLSKVTVEGKDFKQEYNNMELVQIAHYEDGYYFVLREIPQEELDKLADEKMIDWNIKRIDKTGAAILRLALYELKYTDTPHIVVINEAIELAKKYSDESVRKIINAVLDKIIKE